MNDLNYGKISTSIFDVNNIQINSCYNIISEEKRSFSSFINSNSLLTILDI